MIGGEARRDLLEDTVDVCAVDADGYPHEHVLWSFSNLAVDPQEVRTLEGLETKVVLEGFMVSTGR